MIQQKTVSDILTFEELKKYGNRICIIAGVGAGKNHWVENTLSTYGSVLFITSRKAVKDQTLAHEIFTEKAECYGKSCKVTTYAKLGYFLKVNPNPGFGLDEIHYDYIVVDEAHSLISDASFTDAPFYIWEFLKRTSAKVILMTAIIEPIEKMLRDNEYNIVDISKETRNLLPTEIQLIKSKEINDILTKSTENYKMVYMLPSANEAYKLESTLLKEGVKVVAITSTPRIKGNNEELLQREQFTYEFIINNERLPDDVDLILTTSKFREGVNIKDDSVKTVITGCHGSVDIVQFAGRIRTGTNSLIIVRDKQQHRTKLDTTQEKKLGKAILPSINRLIKNTASKSTIGELPSGNYYSRYPECKKLIRLIENHKFELLRFNTYTNQFEMYSQRIMAIKYQEKDISSFKEDNERYIRRLFGKEIRITDDYRQEEQKKKTIEGKRMLDQYVSQMLDKGQQEKLLIRLTEIGIRNKKGKAYSSLGALLTQLGFKLVPVGDKNKDVKELIKNAGKIV